MLIISRTSFKAEVKRIITNLSDGAPGEDGVALTSLNIVLEVAVTPIILLANLTFLKGVFPWDLKIVLICPIYKAKDPMIFSNYRPISLLSLFSKILERLMYNILLEFLSKHNILNKFQFGFRSMHPNFVALVTLSENLRNALDRGNGNWHVPRLAKNVRYCEPQNPVG